MSRIISVHSFRGGTGKSNIVANMAAALAAQGRLVGVIDADIVSPGMHALFGLGNGQMGRTLNDYLLGKCEIKQCAHDVTAGLGAALSGKVLLVPASMKPREIARVLRQGYDVGLLNDGFHQLVQDAQLDVLVVDTHPGLREETLLSIAASDVLTIVLRPDEQHYQGTGLVINMARQLDVPRITLIVNDVVHALAVSEVQARVEQMYGCEVVAAIPHCDEMMTLASAGIFVVRYPDHPLTALLKQVASQLVD
jgi:MinD-like ATPase involved in chromosome partitioning or flagellar assembly